MRRRLAPATFAALVATAATVACSTSPADDAPHDAGTSGTAAGGAGGSGASGGAGSGGDPQADVPPHDPTGLVDFTLGLGLTSTVYQANGSELAGQVGRGFALDTLGPDGEPLRKVWATFSQHDDIPSATQTFGVMHSLDGAATFEGYLHGVDLPPQFAVQLRDGRVLSYAFVPSNRVDSAAGSRLTLDGQVSADDGATWTPFQAVADVPQMSGATGSVGRLSGHPIQLADGTLLLEWYGHYAGDPGSYRAELLASSDGGLTFVRRGSIAVPPANVGYPEADVVQLEDGSLLSVFRHHAGSPQDGLTLTHLLHSRSSDEGATWSAPEPLPIALDGDAAPRVGINPQLTLLPNGILVLSSGRPDNFVAISAAGAGDPGAVAFERALVTYENHPAETSAGYGAAVLRYHGSSGNTGLVVVEPNRLVQIGDNCANGWGCPPEDSAYTIDGKNRVWRRYIEATTPDVGKIDLRGKVQRGAIDVESDMTWTSAAHPRAGVEGAFDGSNDYWSSAVADSAQGTVTLHLDQDYDLTRVGLSIRRDFAGSAAVFVSSDGQSWSEAPIVEATGRTHRALEYFALAKPIRARHVKVLVESSAPCDAELGSSCAFLNELELYSTVDSFENDPVGNAPRGYQDASSAWVTDYDTGAMGRALRIVDDADDAISLVRWRGVPRAERIFAFAVQPLALPGGFLFGIEGVDDGGESVASYHLAVFPDGSVQHHDFATAAWTQVTSPGMVPVGAMSRVRVEATTTGASLSVDGKLVAEVSPSTPGATTLRGHFFSSSGTAPVGDQVLVDDVYFQ